MSKETINVQWTDNMAFRSEVNGHEIKIDAVPEVGGNNTGPRPKPLMLLALGGCTGMDVISILKKMRVSPDSFNIKIESEQTEEHPKHYFKITIIYEFEGSDLPIDKLKRAVELSEERYCGVSYIYKQAIEMKAEIWVNGKIIQ
jgi:putative redox protein